MGELEMHELSVRQVLESCSARQILDIRQTSRQSPAILDASVDDGQRALALLEEGSSQVDNTPLSEYQLNEAFLARAVQVHPACNSHPDALSALRWTACALKHLRLEVRSSSSQSHGSDTSALTDWTLPAQQRDCSIDADEALQLF